MSSRTDSVTSSVTRRESGAKNDTRLELEGEELVNRSIVATSEISDAKKEIVADEVISSKDNAMCAFVFVVLGNASLYFWNALLNCVFDVISQQYPEYPTMSDTLTAVNNTLCFATTVVVLIIGGALHEWMQYTGLTLLAVSSILFCLIVQFMSGHSGYICMTTLQVLAGVGAGFVEGSSFAFACVLPKIYAGWVSFGMGVSGILSFCIYMLFSETVFKGDVGSNVWVNLGVATVLSLCGIGGCIWLFRWPVARACIDRVKSQVSHRHELPDDQKPMSWWNVFKATWGTQLNTCFIMWLTLLLFPNVGPLAWNDSASYSNTVMGMFQLGDFLGRYIPNMAGFLPFVMFPKVALYIVSAVRLVFIPFFVFCKIWTTSPWNNFAVHIILMLCLAITNGWYVTLSLIYNPQTLDKQGDRNRASALGTCFLLFGIAAGLWMAKIFTLF